VDDVRISVSAERRRAPRYLVTLSAQVVAAERVYRTEVLDVSAGGMLLAPASGLSVVRDTVLEIAAAMIGRVRAQVVAVSDHGIHLRIDPPTRRYDSAIERLAILSQAW
jgi:c-di-GMP-binding flagellar brake protein YcgR